MTLHRLSRGLQERYWVADLTQTTLPDRYQRLLELSHDLSSTLDLDSLLNRIVEAAILSRASSVNVSSCGSALL